MNSVNGGSSQFFNSQINLEKGRVSVEVKNSEGKFKVSIISTPDDLKKFLGNDPEAALEKFQQIITSIGATHIKNLAGESYGRSMELGAKNIENRKIYELDDQGHQKRFELMKDIRNDLRESISRVDNAFSNAFFPTEEARSNQSLASRGQGHCPPRVCRQLTTAENDCERVVTDHAHHLFFREIFPVVS